MAATHFSGPVYSTNGFITNVEEVTDGSTLDTTSGGVMVDTTGGNITLALPAAADSAGVLYHIKKTDSSGNIITIDPNGSETIDGDTTVTIATQYESLSLLSDGTNWNII